MISGPDILNFLELQERLKSSNFDMDAYTKEKTNTPPSLEARLQNMSKEVNELIAAFDLTGDKLISPEEFFNIIMYAYN